MLKLIILTTVIFGIYITISANAATKCVALNASSSCTESMPGGTIDWKTTCNDIPISGVGVCSSMEGSGTGQTIDNLATETSMEANKYCWCKMTSPAVSRFVYAPGSGDAATCFYNCAFDCVFYAVTNAAFRAGLFSNLQ